MKNKLLAALLTLLLLSGLFAVSALAENAPCKVCHKTDTRLFGFNIEGLYCLWRCNDTSCEGSLYRSMSDLTYMYHDNDSNIDLITGKCKYCGYQCRDPHTHAKGEVADAGMAPTCMEPGWEPYYKCAGCDQFVDKNANVIDTVTWKTDAGMIEPDPNAHSFTEYVSNNDATCMDDGTKTAVCDNGCGKTDTVLDEGSALGHDFKNYVSDNNATCTQDGTKTAICEKGCGETDTVTDEGTALRHWFVNYVSDGNATCTQDGTKTSKCDRCDETNTVPDAGSATGHSFGEYVSDGNATCLADGTKTAVCAKCGEADTVADEGSALGHSFTNYVSDGNATCTEAGTKTAKCDRCDATDTVADEKLNHVFGEYVSDGNATCLADGTKTATCELCGATDTAADEGSATGHSFGEYVSDGNATCVKDGTKTATCANCGETDTVADAGSAKGHDFTKWYEPFTQLVKDNYERRCKACGAREYWQHKETNKPIFLVEELEDYAQELAEGTYEIVSEYYNVTFAQPDMFLSEGLSFRLPSAEVTAEDGKTVVALLIAPDGTVTETDAFWFADETDEENGGYWIVEYIADGVYAIAVRNA